MTFKDFIRKTPKIPRYIYSKVKAYFKWLTFKIANKWIFFNLFQGSVRPWLWKLTGVKINGKISIGYDVYYDVTNSELITIEEGAWITSRCLLLAHKRDMSSYKEGDDVNKLPYIKAPIHIGKGVHLGMNTTVMPGVTIGDGAIIGSGSVVVKDIPAWTIAVGNPCRVIKDLKVENEDC